MALSEVERELWAKVYAAEYGRLAARVSAMVDKPDPNVSRDWMYGSGDAGDSIDRWSKKRADAAVKKLREVDL